VEGGEIREILPLQEDKGGFDPTIGHEEVAADLGQRVSILGQVRLLLRWVFAAT
jgi:hypothetical protein